MCTFFLHRGVAQTRVPKPPICDLSPRRPKVGTALMDLYASNIFWKCQSWSWENSSTMIRPYMFMQEVLSWSSSWRASPPWQVLVDTLGGKAERILADRAPVKTHQRTGRFRFKASWTMALATVVLPEPGGPSRARILLHVNVCSRACTARAVIEKTRKLMMLAMFCFVRYGTQRFLPIRKEKMRTKGKPFLLRADEYINICAYTYLKIMYSFILILTSIYQ